MNPKKVSQNLPVQWRFWLKVEWFATFVLRKFKNICINFALIILRKRYFQVLISQSSRWLQPRILSRPIKKQPMRIEIIIISPRLKQLSNNRQVCMQFFMPCHPSIIIVDFLRASDPINSWSETIWVGIQEILFCCYNFPD